MSNEDTVTSRPEKEVSYQGGRIYLLLGTIFLGFALTGKFEPDEIMNTIRLAVMGLIFLSCAGLSVASKEIECLKEEVKRQGKVIESLTQQP